VVVLHPWIRSRGLLLRDAVIKQEIVMFLNMRAVVLLTLCCMVGGMAHAGAVHDVKWTKNYFDGENAFVTVTFWSNGSDVYVWDKPAAGVRSMGSMANDFVVTGRDLAMVKEEPPDFPSHSDALWIRHDKATAEPDTSSKLYAIDLGNPQSILEKDRAGSWKDYVTGCYAMLHVWFTTDSIMAGGDGLEALYWNGQSLAEYVNGGDSIEPVTTADGKLFYDLYFIGMDLNWNEANWLVFDVANLAGPADVVFYGELMYTYVGTSIPEPMSMSFLGLGATGLLIGRRKSARSRIRSSRW